MSLAVDDMLVCGSRRPSGLWVPGDDEFSPLDVAGLVAWYKASSIAQADASAVSSWADLSGNSRTLSQATGANQPTYRTAIVGGKPVVRFDGTSDRMVTGVNISATAMAARPRAVFAVVANAAVSGSGGSYQHMVAFGIDSALRAYELCSRVNSTVNWGTAYNAADQTAGESIIAGTGDIVGSLYSGTQDLLYRNGTLKATKTVTLNTGAGPLYVGSYLDSAQWGQFDLAELIIYDASLTTDQRDAVETYLGSEYGIAVS